MNTPKTTQAAVEGPEALVETVSAPQGGADQVVCAGFPVDSTLLDALLELADLPPAVGARRSAKEPLHCSACHTLTEQRCSYCLHPLCEAHGQRIRPWFTARRVLVCPSCQARLREIEREEEDLDMPYGLLVRSSVLL